MPTYLCTLLILIIGNSIVFAQPTVAVPKSGQIKVELDVSECPDLRGWGDEAKQLVELWYARCGNLLPTKDFTPPSSLQIKIRESEKGLAATSGTKITVSSHWIRKHPEDHGVVIHEMVHVLQNYPSGNPWWVTEGIADYLRWGIYEAKPLSWFPRPSAPDGYKKGYRVTAGFFLWLETDKSPGIVKKLNSLMRGKKYQEEFFKQETGQSVDELWRSYLKSDI